MNILFISALEGGKYSGPLHSVPKQIKAQSKEDFVYWINLTNISYKGEIEQQKYNYANYKRFSLKNIPSPFCNPDLVVFEEFFKIECCLVARKLEKEKIPYVIIPRCQMTEKYLQNKWLKKKIASFFLFNHFAKHSLGVQFLSRQEFIDSKKFYKGKSVIIANGIDIPKYELQKKELQKKSNNQIICSFIGRYSIWQKGLDLMLKAIGYISEDLEKNSIHFHLYGPNERTGSKEKIEELVKMNKVSNLVTVNGPVFENDKKQVLINSDLFIHTSRFEGMPMSVLEALSYGIPCIVSKGSNLKEEIEKFDAGWGCETEENDIAQVLKKVLREKELFNKKSINAKKLAEEFSWDSIAKQSHSWYEKILKDKEDKI